MSNETTQLPEHYGTIHDDGYWLSNAKGPRQHESLHAGWACKKVYTEEQVRAIVSSASVATWILLELIEAAGHFLGVARTNLREGIDGLDYTLFRAATYVKLAARKLGGGEHTTYHAGADITSMVDAAMMAMKDIHPPLRRSDCEKLILAAMADQPRGGK